MVAPASDALQGPCHSQGKYFSGRTLLQQGLAGISKIFLSKYTYSAFASFHEMFLDKLQFSLKAYFRPHSQLREKRLEGHINGTNNITLMSYK